MLIKTKGKKFCLPFISIFNLPQVDLYSCNFAYLSSDMDFGFFSLFFSNFMLLFLSYFSFSLLSVADSGLNVCSGT